MKEESCSSDLFGCIPRKRLSNCDKNGVTEADEMVRFQRKDTEAGEMVRFLLTCTAKEFADVFLDALKIRPELAQFVRLSEDLDTYVAEGQAVWSSNGSNGSSTSKTSMSQLVSPVCSASEMCQIQFSSDLFFGLEAESMVSINVMRFGLLDKPSTVPWHTKDGSAKAGRNYKKASGLIEFLPGEMHKTIVIDLINNTDWDPTLDFFVQFDADKVQNAIIQRIHVSCRVKLIDDDAFPTDKFKDKLLSKGPQAVSAGLLMIEYFRMNWKNAVVRRGSIKWFTMDFLDNIKYIFQLYLQVFLVNRIFMPVLRDGEDFTTGRYVALVLVALGQLIPDFLLHGLQYRRNYWKVGGASRKLLQRNLMRTYMSLSANTRSTVGIGEVMLALFNEIPQVVKSGYCNLFPLVRNLTQLVFLLLFQLLVIPVFKDGIRLDITLMNVAVFIIFPLVIVPALLMRQKKIIRLVKSWQDAQADARTATLDMLEHFYLMKDYYKRDHSATFFESKIDKLNTAQAHYNAGYCNTTFIARAVSVIVVAAWVFCGGLLLIQSDSIDLGLWLATVTAFGQMGRSWTIIYGTLLDMQAVFTQLRTVTWMMNLPSEEADLGKFERQCEEVARSLLPGLIKEVEQSGGKEFAIDKLPIRLHKLHHHFQGNKVLEAVNLTMVQGKVHAISTSRGLGKSVILQLCGRRVLMDSQGRDGSFFLPVHLRIRHVSKEPLFVIGTLYENLVYGVDLGDKDRRPERVLAICAQLDIEPETMKRISAEPDADILPWNLLLAASTRHLLNMARGFIANAEVLVIHKPFADLGPKTRPVICDALRNFVDHRGLENDPRHFYHRRPRTCIISVRPDEDVSFADEVHWPVAGKMKTNGAGSPVKAEPSI